MSDILNPVRIMFRRIIFILLSNRSFPIKDFESFKLINTLRLNMDLSVDSKDDFKSNRIQQVYIGKNRRTIQKHHFGIKMRHFLNKEYITCQFLY